MTGVVVTGLGTAIAGIEGPAAVLDGPAGHGGDPLRAAKGMRYKDRATRLALRAAEDALLAAKLPTPRRGRSVGVVVSSNLGNVDTVCEAVTTIAEHTYSATSPMALPNTSSNVIASWVAITHGLRGANLTLCNGPTSGLDAVHWARLLITAGRVDAVVVVGVEPVTEPVRALLPEGRLFDGAAALVAERAEHALARGVRPLAALGTYSRAASVAEAAARAGAGTTIDLRLGTPDGHDLTTRFGECSGALGVLQCVGAVARLCAGAGALLTSAGPADAFAALVLAGAA